MFEKSQKMRIAAEFDRGNTVSGGADRAYLDDLQKLRDAAHVASSNTPEISDGQFGAFMNGIREGIAEPVPSRARFWATLSLAAAALVIVLALLSIFRSPDEPVKANEVQPVKTDLNGTTVDWFDGKPGPPASPKDTKTSDDL